MGLSTGAVRQGATNGKAFSINKEAQSQDLVVCVQRMTVCLP